MKHAELLVNEKQDEASPLYSVEEDEIRYSITSSVAKVEARDNARDQATNLLSSLIPKIK